jgi:hypothetical protein
MPEGSAVQRMFSGIASRYDFANRILSLGLCVGWREQLVAAAKAVRPRVVADRQRRRRLRPAPRPPRRLRRRRL